jgi:ParB family transcriptional regulator, chromosome partitioning protein
MRHDSHFVETLSSHFGAALGRYIPIAELETNPEQPRSTVGDLSELRASIESKGILEPILVRPVGAGRYRIISGERRFRAALEAGLQEIPCIELDVPENEVLEIALIENLHRQDLHPFEEADGYAALAGKHGYTHQRIAEAVGRSRVAVTELLSLAALPEDIRDRCRRADICSKSVLLEIARAGSPGKMSEAIEAVARGGTRESLREKKREDSHGKGRAKRFTFRFADRELPFRLNLVFNKSRVEKDELIDALREIIRRIEDSKKK